MLTVESGLQWWIYDEYKMNKVSEFKNNTVWLWNDVDRLEIDHNLKTDSQYL